jgi:tetratricopeptide (TPR) repeat protein
MRNLAYCGAVMLWMVVAAASISAQNPSILKRTTSTATETDPEVSESNTAPEWDPLKANKDIEVGTFYMKKGDYDAAIDRFEEAARLHPGLALPYLKLGETYEKTKNLPKAVEAYESYLKTYQKAPDAKDVQKKIQDLQKKMGRESNHKTQ